MYAASRGHTHEQLAVALGLSRPAVSQRLSGRNPWTLRDLEALSSFYSITVEDLVSGAVLRLLGVPEAELEEPGPNGLGRRAPRTWRAVSA